MTGGPPISNREIQYLPSLMEHGFTGLIGICLLCIAFHQYRQNTGLWKVRFLVILGSLVLITSPWVMSLHKVVIGAYPTIDKEGSLLFFELGAHHLWLTNPSIPIEETGLHLIGVHIGHLWVTELISVFTPTFVAFNVQIFLHLVLNVLAILYWFDAYEWLSSREWEKWIVALIIGAQLHVFRDIQWYTIEKSALFPLFLFWGVLIRQRKGSSPFWLLPITYLGAGLYNFYWAILCPILIFTEYKHIVSSLKNRSAMGIGLMLSGFCGIGLGLLQMKLQEPHLLIASVEAFAVRSSLDVFSIWPLDWNRMGLWQSVNVLVLIMGLKVMVRINNDDTISDIKGLAMCAFLGFMLSLGPFLVLDVPNPIYTLFTWLPGMWRFAKPEIFFLIPYAIFGLFSLRYRWSIWIWTSVFALYLIGLYTSPAFPYLSEFVEGTLHFKP